MSHHIEAQGLSLETLPSSSGHFKPRHASPRNRPTLPPAGEALSLVVALGASMGAEPVEGVRGGRLGPRDELCGQWIVLVLVPIIAAR